MEQNKDSEKSIQNCYSSRGFKHGFGHQVAKMCSGQRFFGSPRVEYGPRARPGQAGRPWICPFWDLPGQVFFCPGKKHLVEIVLFSGIWRLAGQPPRAGQGLPGLKCFFCPVRKSAFFARAKKADSYAKWIGFHGNDRKSLKYHCKNQGEMVGVSGLRKSK